ncbi:MAG TPA: BadF/BadG/BcrA/BcrD ATPase family protein [Candidatus Limnocylindria bacterium]|nr:BadF/BadG/BcrA/BcrD ATPase family protein [Candidatus Limnocylindria bacterium]
MDRLRLGVDAGNTKTVAVVASADGTVLGAGRALGIADIYAASSVDDAMSVVEAAVDGALAATGAARSDVGAAVVSIAGADWPEDIATIREALSRRAIGSRLEVVNDAIGALVGAVPEGPAVVVSIGTGTATGARGTDGRLWHSSFWQEPQGAFELSRRILSAVYRSELGIDPPTTLTTAVIDAVGAVNVEEVLHRFTARREPRPDVVGPLVRALFQHATAGDRVATTICRTHGRALGQVAAAAARRVDIAEATFAIAFTGAVSKVPGADGLLTPAYEALLAEAPRAARTSPRFEPAIGALVIALSDGGAVTPSTLDRLSASAPPASVYRSG